MTPSQSDLGSLPEEACGGYDLVVGDGDDLFLHQLAEDGERQLARLLGGTAVGQCVQESRRPLPHPPARLQTDAQLLTGRLHGDHCGPPGQTPGSDPVRSGQMRTDET